MSLLPNTAADWTPTKLWNPVTAYRTGLEHPATRTLLNFGLLETPIRWRRRHRVEVGGKGDLFDPDVPGEYIAAAWTTMYWTSIRGRPAGSWKPRHVYRILTRHPARARTWLRSWADRDQRMAMIHGARADNWCGHEDSEYGPWMDPVLPNVALGVPGPDQDTLDGLVPAATRFVALTPLRSRVDLTSIRVRDRGRLALLDALTGRLCSCGGTELAQGASVDWVLAGGESGRRARPLDLDAVRSIRSQCQQAGTALYLTQLGSAWARANHVDTPGRDPGQWPADLQIRQVPPSLQSR